MDLRLSKHFNLREFSCKCSRKCKYKGVTPVSSELVAVLELLRERAKCPIKINCALRCPTHNRDVGGAMHSQHLYGTAADVRCDHLKPIDMYRFLDKLFPNTYGLGLYDTFLHVDVRKMRARWDKSTK